jgi:hypothetical protein
MYNAKEQFKEWKEGPDTTKTLKEFLQDDAVFKQATHTFVNYIKTHKRSDFNSGGMYKEFSDKWKAVPYISKYLEDKATEAFKNSKANYSKFELIKLNARIYEQWSIDQAQKLIEAVKGTGGVPASSNAKGREVFYHELRTKTGGPKIFEYAETRLLSEELKQPELQGLKSIYNDMKKKIDEKIYDARFSNKIYRPFIDVIKELEEKPGKYPAEIISKVKIALYIYCLTKNPSLGYEAPRVF